VASPFCESAAKILPFSITFQIFLNVFFELFFYEMKTFSFSDCYN